MDILEIVLIVVMQMTTVLSKRYISTSDESIENLLYYKDCKHRPKETTESPILLRGAVQTTRQPDCPFPKMCCSLSCGNDCANPQPFGRQMDSVQPIQPIQPMRQSQPLQPPLNPRGRKKKMKMPMMPEQPPSRRNYGFTKEKIKNLISQDGDIRKILKDLVRVTMQKVDLLDMLNEKKEAARNSQDSESDEELE